MIEEINIASNSLTKSSAKTSASSEQQDPLAQIVRVLNSHLAQLQSIDVGAAELGKRLEAAKLEARSLGGGFGGHGGLAESGVDGFMRSWGGRR